MTLTSWKVPIGGTKESVIQGMQVLFQHSEREIAFACEFQFFLPIFLYQLMRLENNFLLQMQWCSSEGGRGGADTG